jgi:hypothetical protein
VLSRLRDAIAIMGAVPVVELMQCGISLNARLFFTICRAIVQRGGLAFGLSWRPFAPPVGLLRFACAASRRLFLASQLEII